MLTIPQLPVTPSLPWSHVTEAERAIKASILNDKVREWGGVFNINESVFIEL